LPRASSHFWWLPTSLSILLSTLGILALARHAFVTWSLSAPLELVMAAYNGTMQLLLGWAHPYLQAALTWLGSFIGWRPTLYPHWKDVLVVTSLIGIGASRAAWQVIPGGVSIVAIKVIVGACVTALAAGMLPLQSPDLVTQLLIASSVGLIALPMLVIEVRRNPIGTLIGVLQRSALAALATYLLSLVVGHVGGIGLAGLASVVVLDGLLILVDGMFRAPKHLRLRLIAWGLTILGGFVGGAFLAIVDAGLRLLGA
jgi:hypothetical protein